MLFVHISEAFADRMMTLRDEFLGLSDEKVLILLREGNEKAFDCLYRRYRDKLVSIANRRIRSKELAEELVQDVFVNVWQKRESIHLRHTFFAYIYTAVKYKILDHISSLKVKERYIDEMGKFLDASLNVTELEIDFNELDYHLNKNISDLPEKCQEAFRLSRFESYSIKEIAEKLDISQDTAKYHIAQALKKLRKGLKELYLLFL